MEHVSDHFFFANHVVLRAIIADGLDGNVVAQFDADRGGVGGVFLARCSNERIDDVGEYAYEPDKNDCDYASMGYFTLIHFPAFLRRFILDH